MAASQKPSAVLPTSPMKMRARGKLNGRKPSATAAPITHSQYGATPPAVRREQRERAGAERGLARGQPFKPSMKLCRLR
jgi:hypothetical protein